MPLPNRVDPFGELFADPARGLMFGNRGGRFHRDDRTLGARRFVSRRWICCQLDFKGRHRQVWGEGYTELFFLDEVTALAAGHRPCFECRRREAEFFAACWAKANGETAPPQADAMDRVLHAERLARDGKRRHTMPIDTLPDGAMIAMQSGGVETAFALRGSLMLPWTPRGYGTPQQRVRGAVIDVLTPPSILGVLAAGYSPLWHSSAATP